MMLRPAGVLGGIASWGAKLPGAIARVAGLLWLAEHPPNGASTVIDEATVRNAIAIARYAIPHALAAFVAVGSDRQIAGAKAILTWLRDVRASRPSKCGIHQALRGRFASARDLDPSLEMLVAKGYLRHVADDHAARRGRPSKRYVINPLAFE